MLYLQWITKQLDAAQAFLKIFNTTWLSKFESQTSGQMSGSIALFKRPPWREHIVWLEVFTDGVRARFCPGRIAGSSCSVLPSQSVSNGACSRNRVPGTRWHSEGGTLAALWPVECGDRTPRVDSGLFVQAVVQHLQSTSNTPVALDPTVLGGCRAVLQEEVYPLSAFQLAAVLAVRGKPQYLAARVMHRTIGVNASTRIKKGFF